jgi:hypothetical protein
MVELIFDLAVHPNAEIDVDEIAAASMSLLAYLGQLGRLVDALEARERVRAANQRQAPGSAS